MLLLLEVVLVGQIAGVVRRVIAGQSTAVRLHRRWIMATFSAMLFASDAAGQARYSFDTPEDFLAPAATWVAWQPWMPRSIWTPWSKPAYFEAPVCSDLGRLYSIGDLR